ncbi:MAG TPA: hypothetical protein ENK24_01000, partial [Anaerolineae bacterium]|nr:hypothetical protein [Anaerolineae bacterium]
MKNIRASLLFITAALLLGLALFSAFPHSVTAQGPEKSPDSGQVEVIGQPVEPVIINVDMNSLPPAQTSRPGQEIPRLTRPPLNPNVPPPAPVVDPLLKAQQNAVSYRRDRDFDTTLLNFEGFSESSPPHPPDTVGDVGPNHYIQMTNGGNTSVMIFDKAGQQIGSTFSLSSLWTAGGNCATGYGDPIVLYDRLADRWMLAEFAQNGNHLCIYISQTPDPTAGNWYGYDFTTPDFPDYPKYAVWGDAYYAGANEGPAVYAFDRQNMLAGNTARAMQRFTAPGLSGFGFQMLIPGDLDGATPPPTGAPAHFMRHHDTEAHGNCTDTGSQDCLEIWDFHVDWNTPANSTFARVQDIAVTEFDSDLCGLSSFNCFPQPGTTQTLDPLREVVMWRLQYRNFGDHESLVGNFVTDVDGSDHGGIRWFELRKAGANPWSLYQEGTYAPDLAHRWMGSIAMDGSGNIALAYSVSDAVSVYPSIRYAGRLASDSLNALPQGEHTIIAGGSSQTGVERWGDYNAMSVDPADDCTFWYTGEYMPASGDWHTRIAAFKFDACGSADFPLSAAPPAQEICAPNPVDYTISVGQVQSYTDQVTLTL